MALATLCIGDSDIKQKMENIFVKLSALRSAAIVST